MKMHTVRSHQSKSEVRMIKTRPTRPPKLPLCCTFVSVWIVCMYKHVCVLIVCSINYQLLAKTFSSLEHAMHQHKLYIKKFVLHALFNKCVCLFKALIGSWQKFTYYWHVLLLYCHSITPYTSIVNSVK